MNLSRRTACLFLAAALAGCHTNYYEQHLGSHLPKADGSMLDVDCYSYVRHTVSSVSPTLGNEPAVTVVLDDRTFVVTATQVRLNGELYAAVPYQAKKLLIEVTEQGFTLAIDGQPAELLSSPGPTGLPAG